MKKNEDPAGQQAVVDGVLSAALAAAVAASEEDVGAAEEAAGNVAQLARAVLPDVEEFYAVLVGLKSTMDDMDDHP